MLRGHAQVISSARRTLSNAVDLGLLLKYSKATIGSICSRNFGFNSFLAHKKKTFICTAYGQGRCVTKFPSHYPIVEKDRYSNCQHIRYLGKMAQGEGKDIPIKGEWQEDVSPETAYSSVNERDSEAQGMKQSILSANLREKVTSFAAANQSEIIIDNQSRAAAEQSEVLDTNRNSSGCAKEEPIRKRDIIQDICLQENIDDDVIDKSSFASGNPDNSRQEDQKHKKKNKKRKSRQNESSEEHEPGAPKRSRPNYFISIQVTNKQIQNRVKEVQEAILNKKPELKGTMIPTPTLHLTLMVMNLKDDEDIKKASEALDNSHDKLKHLCEKPIVLTVENMGNFRHNVLFAQVGKEKIPELQEVVEVVEESFKAVGIPSTDERGFKPHITIAKMSKDRKLSSKRGAKINQTLYHQFVDRNFGIQTVCSLQVCAMMKPKDKTGYYHVEHEVRFVSEEFQDEEMKHPAKVHKDELVRILDWTFKEPE